MAERNLNWALPVMRVGYAGRGLTYLAISTLSLWTIWQGGQAKGTAQTMAEIESSPFGIILLTIIGAGLISYMLWRVVDGVCDLEDEGSDAKGLIGRGGMIVTGLIHGAIGLGVLLIAYGSKSGSGESSIASTASQVMQMPMGRWIVGLAGALTLAAGIYYLHKGIKQSYRSSLRSNHFTRHWSGALRAGVIAQGVTVGIIGAFLIYAGLTANPQEAGGLGQTFGWLSEQAYGRVLVTLLCAGLLGFALFLFVNAAYRIVPRLSDPDVTSLRETVTSAS